MVWKQTSSENHESPNDLSVSHVKLGWFRFEDSWKVHERVRTVGEDLGSDIWADAVDSALCQDKRTNVGEV